ncbi:MAG: hypothetical protein IKE28_07595 [Solobacterium sp.]|nr:hypothetical protein [Solobacterium sp.]
MKNNRLNQFLFALILSLGILFGHTSLVLADEEPEVEPTVQDNNEQDNNIVVTNDNSGLPTPDVNLDQVQGIDPQDVIQQGEVYLAEGFDNFTEESDDSVNVLQVEGAIIEAGATEIGTIVVAQPIDEEYKEPIVENESGAIGLDDEANDHLANAVVEGVKADVEIAKDGIEITKDVIGIGIDVIQSEVAVNQAEEAEEAAQQNYNDTLNANTQVEAFEYANEADENATKAEEAAKVAHEQAEEAYAKLLEATAAYDAAQKEYAETKELVQNELAAGVISLSEAKAKTEAAKNVAEDYYNEMIAAQEQAELNTEIAKSLSEAADDALKASIEELANMVADSAGKIAKQTAITAASGVAYEVAIIIDDIENNKAQVYEDKISELEDKRDELQGAIAEAEGVIAEKQLALEALDADDAEYPVAKKQLEEAEQELAEAWEIYNNAERIIEEHNKAIKAGIAQTITTLSDKLNNGEITLAEKQDLAILTVSNIGNYQEGHKKVTDAQFVTDDVLRVEYEDGTAGYYTVVEKTSVDDSGVEKHYLDFYKTDNVKGTEIDKLPDLDSYEGSTETQYIAVRNQDTYDIKVGDIASNRFYYAGNVLRPLLNDDDNKGYYFYNIGGKKQYVKVIDTELYHFEKKGLALFDSTSIPSYWRTAEIAETNLNEKLDAFDTASANEQAALERYTEAKNEIQKAINEVTSQKEGLESELKDTNTELNSVKAEYEGGLIDQAITGVLNEDYSGVSNLYLRIAQLELKKAIHTITEEEEIELAALENGVTFITDAIQVIAKIQQGGLEADDVIKFVQELTDVSFATKTKSAISHKIRELLGEYHSKQVEKLNEVIGDSKDEIKEQLKEVKSSVALAAICKVAYLSALEDEVGARIKAGYAKLVYEAAKKADEKAGEALEKYKAFQESFDPGKKLLDVLEKEMTVASLLYAKAWFNDYSASISASSARAAADNAMDFAEHGFYKIWVSGIQVNERNKENVLGDENASVKFDNDTNTLYLDNAEINVKKVIGGIEEELDIVAGVYSEVDNLNIIVNGVNSIIAKKKLIFNEYDTVAGIYAVDKNGENANLKLLGTLPKNAELNIDLTNFKADDFAVGIKGDVTIRDFDSLRIKTSDVTMNADIDASLLNDQYPYSRPQEFFAPASVGINGAVTIDNSNVELLVGKGTLNYGIAAFLEKEIEVKNHSDLFIALDDVSDSSTGISAKSLDVEDSCLTVTSGNAMNESNNTTSSAIDPISITIKDSIVEATSGDASYSFAFFTPGAIDIMFVTSEGVTNSRIRATAGRGSEGNNIAILGNINVIGNGTLIAEAIEGDYGIGLAGFLSATDDSVISLKGSKQAIYYPDEKFEPDVGTRSIFVSDSTSDPEKLVLWKGGDLRSEDIHWITVGTVEKSNYVVIDGGDASWTEGGTSPLSIEIDNTDTSSGAEDPFDHFVDAYVDNTKLTKDVDYTLDHGSVIINLQPSYLKNLSAGWHTLRAVFNNSDDVISRFNIIKNSSGGGNSSSKSSNSNTSSVVTCQMAGYPNGYAWNEAAKACQPGYIDNNGVFHSYSTAARRTVPKTADEGVSPFYLMILMLFGASGLGLLLKKENYN